MELMEVLMAALPPGEVSGHLFKAIFLHCLPEDLKDLMVVQVPSWRPWSWRIVSVIRDARNSKKTVVVAVRPAPEEEEACWWRT